MGFLWPLVHSVPSGPAYSAAERERSRGGVCLCQAALILLGALVFSSAEITGWHSETTQWEPKTLKKKKLELPSVAFPAEGGWRNSGFSGGSLPRRLGPPQPQFCSPPALLPAEPVPVCQDLFPAQGPSLLLLLCSTAGA